MNTEQLDELERLIATGELPWVLSGTRVKWRASYSDHMMDSHAIGPDDNKGAVCLVPYDERYHARDYGYALLIHKAVNSLPALISDSRRLEQAERENAELTKALTGLTCGGSEFFIRKGERYVADIPACVAYVNQVRTSQHETICREVSARQAAEARSQSLQEEVERERARACVLLEAAYEAADWLGPNNAIADEKLVPAILQADGDPAYARQWAEERGFFAQSALTATDPKTGGEG